MDEINIINVPIESVVPYALNNKIHTPEQIDRIANSISMFGFNQPICIDEKNVVLVGHGRLAAAKKLGLRAVPAIKLLNLTETGKKAYRIIDNKTASDTAYDLGNLKLEVAALEELKFDVSAFHFEEFKLDPPPAEQDGEEEEKEPTGEEWIGQIKLSVPADCIDAFEAELIEIMGRYHGISKETKRVK